MLKHYDVVIYGNATTLLLSDADAKAAGLTPRAAVDETVVVTKAKTPANKARKPVNKTVETAEQA